MEFAFGIFPEPDLRKAVDNLRYHYDRPLLKEQSPYIQILGPVEGFINMKKAGSLFSSMVKQKKRFRLTTDIIGMQESEGVVFLNIFHKGEIRELHDRLLEELGLHDTPVFYMPHIILAKNHSSEELHGIYEELKDTRLEYSFFAWSFCLYEKSGRRWEEYLTVEI